jgi:hypothetical protein
MHAAGIIRNLQLSLQAEGEAWGALQHPSADVYSSMASLR